MLLVSFVPQALFVPSVWSALQDSEDWQLLQEIQLAQALWYLKSLV